MSDPDPAVSDFLTRYAASLTEFDAGAASDLWALPGIILDDRFAGVLESREAMIAGLEQSFPFYRRLGLASVRFELLGQEELSRAITLVHVRWLFLDADGGLLTDSHSYYVLRSDDRGVRACVCIETDAAEKLAALAAERDVDLPRQGERPGGDEATPDSGPRRG